MREPCKMFSLVLPYTTFERLQVVAKAQELSVGRTIRMAVETFLEKTNTGRQTK